MSGQPETSEVESLRADARERRFLRSVLESMSAVILRVGLDGVIEYINQILPEYESRPPVGQSIYSFAPPEQHDLMRGSIDLAIRTLRPAEYESVAAAPDGTRDWYHTTVVPIVEDDAVVGVTLCCTNVTRVKAAEAAMHHQRELESLARDAGNVGVWWWDRLADHVTWDDKLCAMFGVSPAEAPRTAEAFLALVSEDQRPRLRAHIEASVASGVYMDFELRIDTPDGVRWYVIKGGATRGEDGEVNGLLGGVVDETERRQLMAAVQQAQQLDAMGRLAAGVAHNFNNMLAGIVPALALARRVAAPELAQMYRDAEQCALRAAELVKDLMLLGRRELSTSRSREALDQVIRRVVELCQRTFSRKIAVICELSAEVGAVTVDGVQMEQAILNLMLNARDAVSEHGVETPRVALTATRVDAESGIAGNPWPAIEVRVVDTGVGMDEATRARVFEPFFTTKPAGAGTGLGLATAWATIKAHGGTLTCESSPAGSVFSFRIPLEQPDADDGPHPAVVSPGEQPHTPASILVVDDEEVVRRATAMILRAQGYDVATAGSGAEGVRVFAEHPADLVLLDYSMPGQGAEATLAQLRALRPGLPVIIFSGLAVAVEGATSHLTKPANLDELDAEIQRVLAAARRD